MCWVQGAFANENWEKKIKVKNNHQEAHIINVGPLLETKVFF